MFTRIYKYIDVCLYTCLYIIYIHAPCFCFFFLSLSLSFDYDFNWSCIQAWPEEDWSQWDGETEEPLFGSLARAS